MKPDSLIGEKSEEEMVLQTTNSRIGEVLNDEIELSSSSFIIQKIQELNPGVEIKTDVDRSMIFSSLPVEELVLPEGFYFNYKNGITNKHNTQSGRYGSVHVYIQLSTMMNLLFKILILKISSHFFNSITQKHNFTQFSINIKIT